MRTFEKEKSWVSDVRNLKQRKRKLKCRLRSWLYTALNEKIKKRSVDNRC
jgi:hypothetical protein